MCITDTLHYSNIYSIVYLKKFGVASLCHLRRWRWHSISFKKVEVASTSHSGRWRCHPRLTQEGGGAIPI